MEPSSLFVLTSGRDPALVATPETMRHDGRQYDPTDPLYAIWGEDPRTAASVETGRALVDEITRRLAERVVLALQEVAAS
jgi:hypothetical protein